MKIGSSITHIHRPTEGTKIPSEPTQPASDFEGRVEGMKAAEVAKTESAGEPAVPNFTAMTKKDYVAWGRKAFEQGAISLDDLFQVQYAGGDFDGSVSTDDQKHNFVSFFNGLIDNEYKAHRATGAQSMVPAYQSVLLSMKRAAST